MPITPKNLVRHELIGLAVRIDESGEFSGTVVDCLKKRGYWLLRIKTEDGSVIECAYHRRVTIGSSVRFNVVRDLLVEL